MYVNKIIKKMDVCYLRIILCSVAICVLIFFPSSLVFGQESLWQTFPSLPLSRSDYTGNAVDSKIYLIQGIGAGANFTMYDTITGNYTELPPVPYSAHHSASAVRNEIIYVAGGCDFGDSCPTTAAFNITSNTWTNLPDMPLSNWAATAKIVDDDFFVIGGNPNVNACQKYNIPTNSWSLCANMPTGREHLSSAVYDNKIYVINGREGSPGDLTANEVYDPVTNSWQILTDKPIGMAGGWGGIFDDKIFVMGGENSLTGANEWYDPETDFWTIGPDMPTPRHGLVCESVGFKIYCFGGGTFEGGGISAVVEVFDANTFVQTIFANLTVIKDVVNDNNGTNVSGDFTMVITANNPSDNNFAGSNSSGTTITIDPGAYSVDETGPGGYDVVFSSECSGTAVAGDAYTCTITNDDSAPIICNPPVEGDWTVTQSCTLDSSVSLAGSIIVQNGVMLTILDGVALDIDFANFGLSINFNGGVLIKAGGVIR